MLLDQEQVAIDSPHGLEKVNDRGFDRVGRKSCPFSDDPSMLWTTLS